MSRRIIEGSYARLKALKDPSYVRDHYLHKTIGDDFTSILVGLRKEVQDDFSGFDLTNEMIYNRNDPSFYYSSAPVSSKISQLVSYLEHVHRASSRIVEIGSIYNLIKDEELKSRCSDLLSASEHFDRVINQATQVLEERIRQFVPDHAEMTGLPLVMKAMNAELAKSKLIFSDVAAEQEGYVNIFKGLIGAFRNQSHHRFLENVTREQALQICAFIDNMLAVLASAKFEK
jgi:Protein of unknown function (Hypoth_ymh)